MPIAFELQQGSIWAFTKLPNLIFSDPEAHIIRGRSQTMLTIFWLFLTTYPPALTFSMVWTLTKCGHFWTSYLPCLVNVIVNVPQCELLIETTYVWMGTGFLLLFCPKKLFLFVRLPKSESLLNCFHIFSKREHF